MFLLRLRRQLYKPAKKVSAADPKKGPKKKPPTFVWGRMGFHYGVRYRPMRQFPIMTTSAFIAERPFLVLEGSIMGVREGRQPLKRRKRHVFGRKSLQMLRVWWWLGKFMEMSAGIRGMRGHSQCATAQFAPSVCDETLATFARVEGMQRDACKTVTFLKPCVHNESPGLGAGVASVLPLRQWTFCHGVFGPTSGANSDHTGARYD